MDLPSNFHAVGFSVYAASSNISFLNRFRRRSHRSFVQKGGSWRCCTDVKLRRETSQKSRVHWSCPSWPTIFFIFSVDSQKLKVHWSCPLWSAICLIFSTDEISRDIFCSHCGRLLATADMRFGQSSKSLVALWIACAISKAYIFVGESNCGFSGLK
jgi:phage FluMu protein Com